MSTPEIIVSALLCAFGILAPCTIAVLWIISQTPVVEEYETEEERVTRIALHQLRSKRDKQRNSLHYVPLPQLRTPDDPLRV